MGRSLQERFGQPPQVIVTTTITPGIDGKEKQSKSIGNYIGVGHSPRDKFGRIMRIPDQLIADYFRVYTEIPLDRMQAIEERAASAPMEAKLDLAEEIVRRYHGDEVAEEERGWFEQTFSQRKTPEELPECHVAEASPMALTMLQAVFPEGKSKSELRRLLAQGAVVVDGRPVRNADERVPIKAGGTALRVGKRHFFKVVADALSQADE